MNLYEAMEFFKNLYPGKQITYEFDARCHRILELIYTDGSPNLIHHIENNKVKVSVEGMDSMYVPIAPHREVCTWEDMKKMINSELNPQ